MSPPAFIAKLILSSPLEFIALSLAIRGQQEAERAAEEDETDGLTVS